MAHEPMSDEAFAARMRQLLFEEVKQENPRWFYTSYVGDNGFLGATIVMAFGLTDATAMTWRLGINPGGETLTYEVPPAVVAKLKPEHKWRILSADEARALDNL